MIRATDIKRELLHLVGWQQGYTHIIDTDLTQSTSGQYFQQEHPLLTIDNIYVNAPNFSDYTYIEWVTGNTYSFGDIVVVSQQLYRCIATSSFTSSTPPPSDTTNWVETTSFSAWLFTKTEDAILKAVQSVLTTDKIKTMSHSLMSSRFLVDSTNSKTDTIDNEDYLVGFEISPIRSNGVTIKLNRIGIQTTGSATVTIYIWHSSQLSPVYSITKNVMSTGYSTVWFDLSSDIFLPYYDDSINAGGSWFIGYKQSSLGTTQAIKTNYDFSTVPCHCHAAQYNDYFNRSRFMSIHPFRVPESNLSTNELWDINGNEYIYDNNWGLNIEYTILCDLTNFIVQQQQLFAEVISKQVGVNMLKEMAMNPNQRINRTESMLDKDLLMYEINGDTRGYTKNGLYNELQNAIKKINMDISGLDSVCLPCKKSGILFKSI